MNNKENRHSASSEEQCREMERKNNWKLKRIEPTKDPVLPVDCVFTGEQTSFQDQWSDNQE